VSVIAAGTPAPEFTLTRADGEKFTREDLLGKTTVLVFYPFAFSGGCTTQLTLYQPELETFTSRGATLYAVSTDARQSQAAFKDALGSSIEQLSDFEPKGAAATAFGALHPAGMTTRAIVIIGPDGVVKWSHEEQQLGDVPPVELIHAALDAV
jgi:peroxiredoxin